MKNNNIDQLKNDYINIVIPEELDFAVRKSLMEGKKKMNRQKYLKIAKTTAATAAVITAVFTVGINTSEALALTLSEIPVINKIVRVLTFREYNINEDTYNANIKTPAIEGLENKELESSLNEKYLEENKLLYEQFAKDMESMKANNGGHLGVDSGYVVKTDTDKILSVGRYVVNTVGSSSTTFQYDTIDKENEILITLPSLFKDESYIDIISENIKEQMIKLHEIDEYNVYWIEGIEDSSMAVFNKISSNQSFYINNENKLVISFDKYEVAPGYMGVLEFEIPSDILGDVLISDEYIK
ncbi:RsiV family protein [Sedimentibacter saalensis]|uniref:RsiV family protein n=1 Tax=Sedimentibacter saalensis TaxID=130788 RepID=UPI0028A2DCAB|nr:RsiV family protein [Sedimentibacter saalensis]